MSATIPHEKTEQSLDVDLSPHRRIALVLGALTFGLYLRTLAPGLLAGDPGEFQFAAWNWGLAHPTGYPLYLMIGGLWQRLLALVGISPATALNALSALYGATAVGLLYRLLAHWLAKIAWFTDEPSMNLRLVQFVSLFGALMLAANPTFWSQSLIAEVYTLQILFFVLVLWVFPVGETRRGRQRRREGAKGREETQSQSDLLGTKRRVIGLALISGLALTHHAMTLLLLPCVGLTLLVTNRHLLRAWTVWVGGLLALLVPLLLYLYVPLRSGVDASPWYHQVLGTGRLDLYTNDWASFVQFISGRSISVGFRGVGDALGQLGFAWGQWVLHLSWGGVIMALIGVVALGRAAFVQAEFEQTESDQHSGDAQVAKQILLLTLPYALLQQIFNLFYNIGDIYVYYIPLYLIGAIWAAFGVASLVRGRFWAKAEGLAKIGKKEKEKVSSVGLRLGFAVLAILMPLLIGRGFMPQVDQSENVGTRLRWEGILAANPPDDAILISNDRNEIVPLFYTQFVEARGPNRTGLFPLIAPDARFSDIGSTIETALQGSADRPIYLIKPMPGLEARFDLAERTPPLVEVLGNWADTTPEQLLDRRFGPLTLIGYDWQVASEGVNGGQIKVVLHWRVEETLAADYTTTVQLYDAAMQRVAQDDRAPGGVFYGTSHWKVGERILDRHVLDGGRDATDMLVGMYFGPTFEMPAPPLEISLPQ